MAVLGVQVVFSMVMFTFLHKLAPYYSFGRWLLSKRLYRYLHPTNDELKQLMSDGGQSGKQQSNQSGKGRRRAEQRKVGSSSSEGKTESFTVPRNLGIQLDQARVEDIDLVTLQYYSEYTWLMDFSISAVTIYVLTEIYYILAPHRVEFNVSVLWCLLAIVFCIKVLANQAWVYMRTEEGGERVLLITFTFFFLVFAMGVLVVGDHVIEFGLEEGYMNFSNGALHFLEKQGIASQGPLSFVTFKAILVIFSTLTAALFTFPGIRIAKLHLDSLKYAQDRKVLQLLLQINYLLPLFIVLMWVKPVGRDLFCGRGFATARAIMYEDQFDGFRLVLILAMCMLRLLLMPLFMQSHLNLAHEKIEKMKKESGRINNVELQRMVARVFFYLCVVAIQYIAPVLIILFLTFLYKTLSSLSWVGLLGETAVKIFIPGPKPETSYPNLTGIGNNTLSSIMDSAAELTIAFGDLRGIFTPVWYRGVLSYCVWWVMTVWFSSASLGVMYYSQND
ncbi:transmembrane protein 161b-like [Plakobranchus ocellatus]|uniref:Transmembrane protein 161b-like n=1 Tax=Plakobranchus ocellatus TaxID=259542 RepID=A0AAV3YDR1_9GAST|nr:transmembrane protein 161b-like [Plakobranchus ocellatus]